METPTPFSEIRAYDSYIPLLLLFGYVTFSAVAASLAVILFFKKVMGVELGTFEPATFAQGAAYILFCGLALKRLGVGAGASLRDWRKNLFGDVLDALKYFGAYIVLISGLTGAAMLFRHFYPAVMSAAMSHVSPDETKYAATAAVKASSHVRFFILSFAILVLGPVGEELFFRRLMYVTLRKRMRFLPALLICSVLFSLAHLSASLFVLPVGLLLGWVYEKRRRLPVNILLHAMINVFVLYSRLG
jgi:membrane protease YdiL (CAAX protease family)